MKINMCLLCRCVIALFLLALPAVVQAQFTLTTNYNLLTITGYTGPGGAVVIPAEIDGYAVVDIGGYAFAYSTSLTGITIPGSVTNVGDWAFAACSSLASVSISNGVITIGEGAFADCSSLTSVTIPASVTNVGGSAFAFCTNLTAAYFEDNAPPDDGTNFYGDPHAIVYYEAGTTGWGPTFGGAPTEEVTPAPYFGYDVYDGSITITHYGALLGAVVIPPEINGYPVTSIGMNSFSSSRLTSVTIPNTVTSIAQNAFSDCQSLTNVIINGDSVTNIGEFAFANCSSLTSVTIPDSVTIIGPEAFGGCVRLASVTIPDGVITIGTGAFAGCDSLTSITIPGSITNIGDDAFANCTNLTAAYFEGNAPPDDGTIFSGDTNTIVYFLRGTTGWGPMFGGAPTEEEMAVFGFEYQVSNGSILITGYTGPEGPVVIPAEINGYAVAGIGGYAFEYGTNLTSVTIPNSVTNIGEDAFLGCASLTNISVNAANPDYSSLNGVLFDKGQDTLIEYPDGLNNGIYIIPTNVTSIGAEAFSYCSSVASVDIPGSVTNIGGFAFAFCTNLTVAYFEGNAPPDAGNAFHGDPDAVVYYLPGTTGWGAAFGGAPAEVVTPPSEFLYVWNGSNGYIIRGSYPELSGVVTIPPYINGYAVTSVGGGPPGFSPLVRSVTILNGVTSIGQGAFANCGLTNIVIPNSVTSIGPFAFNFCNPLTSIKIPNSVTSIGVQAFATCVKLASITIPSSVTNIGDYAFESCYDLESAYFEGNAPPDDGTAFNNSPTTVYYLPGTTGWGPTFGGAPTEEITPASDFEYNVYDGSITILGYTGPTGPIVIPSVIDGYPVTSISGTGPNSGFRNVTSVTMPNTVTSIGGYAFSDCQMLTNVIVGDGVTNIEQEAFDGCDSLASVTIPNSVTIIGMDAFATCVRLAGVTIPGDVTTIGAAAFGGCDSLTSVSVPASVTNIGICPFGYCTRLTNISVAAANPAYVSTNGILFDKAYDTLVQYPAGLTSNAYIIPNSVTSIEGYAFEGCTNLTSVTVPNIVTNIGGLAFEFCTKLTSAYFEGNAPPDFGNAFHYDPNDVVYYLPGTTGWSPTFGGAPTELWNPQATAFTRAGNQFGFSISGPTNATVVVYACTNLANPVWLPVSTNILSGSGTSSFSDPQPMNSPKRYYRISAP